MTSQAKTLVDYYRQNRFNPVPIDLGSPAAIAEHTAKRQNLYEWHLGIPLGLLRGQEVLEFGCNSGENALVLQLVRETEAFRKLARSGRPSDISEEEALKKLLGKD